MSREHGSPNEFDPPPVTRRGVRQAAGWSAWGVVGTAALIIALVVFGAMWIFGWGFFQRSTADFRGHTKVIEKRADGGYRIQNYEAFYDLCASVQTKETAIAALQEQLARAEPESMDYRVVSGQLVGTKASRAADINQYNSDARKQDTKGHFLASDLPYKLDETQEKTTCEVP